MAFDVSALYFFHVFFDWLVLFPYRDHVMLKKYIYIYIERERERLIDWLNRSHCTFISTFLWKKSKIYCIYYENQRWEFQVHDFKIVKGVVRIAMDVRWKRRRKESVYKKEKFMTAYTVFLFLKILWHCCHVDWCLNLLGFSEIHGRW